jgi:voltage-gated sodium channel
MGIVRPVMIVYPLAWVFFVPFILITSFAVLNLFIGIIVDAMQQQNSDDKQDLSNTLLEELMKTQKSVNSLKEEIDKIKKMGN